MDRWREENTHLRESDFSAFFLAYSEKEKELGIPSVEQTGPTGLQPKFLSTWTLKLRAPLRDPNTDEIQHGHRLTHAPSAARCSSRSTAASATVLEECKSRLHRGEEAEEGRRPQNQS